MGVWVREDQPGTPGYTGSWRGWRADPPITGLGGMRAVRTPMTVDEFLARFPEVPPDLCDEPVLGEYVHAFGLLLRVAQKPTPCMRDTGDHQHFFYTRLVNDLAIYGIGLAKRDRTLARLRARLDQYQQQPATFACTLVPRKARGTPRTGCA
jgi:hypothetical protein